MASSKNTRKARVVKAARSLKRRKQRQKDRELAQQQARERLRQQGLEQLQHKIEADGHYSRANIRVNPEGEVKMSEVLTAFVAPYVDDTQNQQQYENLLGLAVVAWNLSFMSADQRLPTIRAMYESTKDPEAARFYVDFLTRMIQRKHAEFADCDRMIINFNVSDTGDEYRVAVASTLPNER